MSTERPLHVIRENQIESPTADTSEKQSKFQKVKARLERPAKFLAKNALRAGFIGLCGFASLRAFGTAEGKVGPFEEIRADLSLDASGDTVANLGLGDIRYDFFDGILGINARSHRVNAGVLQQFQEIANTAALEGKDPAKALTKAYEDEASSLATKALINGGIAALIGGAFGGFVAELSLRELRRRGLEKGKPDGDFLFRNLLIGPTAVLVLGGVSMGVGLATFNKDAFQNPQFNRHDALGALVTVGESAFGTIDSYISNSERINTGVENFIQLQKSIGAATARPDGLIPIIMVSDIHSKPCAYDRIKALVDYYDAAAVFNAGDETEWGFSFELSIFSRNCAVKNPEELGVPMVFVGGNHDSQNVIDALKSYENAINLDGNIIKLKLKTNGGEITFLMLGDNDPIYTSDPTKEDYSDPAIKAAWTQREVEMGERLAQIAFQEQPDVIMVHEPDAANKISEILGPDYEGVIISGHAHRYRLEQQDKLVKVMIPSTGASGLRGFEDTRSSNVNGLLVSYFNKETKELEQIKRFYIDNYGSICIDDIYLKNAPLTGSQQLSCDVAKPSK